MLNIRFVILGVYLIFCACPPALFAIEKPSEELQEVGIKRNLGGKVDMSLPFTNGAGEKKPLSEWAKSGKPLMIVPVYYECPRLCGLLLGGVTTLLNELDLEMGREYEVLTVSFDPREGPALAAKREGEYHKQITKSGSNLSFWQFLVGEKSSVDPLMKQIGFQFKEDGEEDFAHTAAVIILTPEGEISQYFTGIDFSAWDVRLALIEASQGKIGSLLDQVLLFCFRYDHLQGRYTWAAFNFVRVGAILTVIAVFWIIFVSSRRRIDGRSPNHSVKAS